MLLSLAARNTGEMSDIVDLEKLLLSVYYSWRNQKGSCKRSHLHRLLCREPDRYVCSVRNIRRSLHEKLTFLCFNVYLPTGPYTVLTPEAPIHYRTTWITLICSMSIVIVISLALRFYFVWENARRDRLYGSSETRTPPIPGKEADKDVAAFDGDNTAVPVL